MITHIRTKGFKGFDIDEDIPEKVIYNGANMSGKSTRAAAIALALYGHIPFLDSGKKPGEILESFGQDCLVVAVTIGGKEFGRKFARNEKGSVGQSLQVDGKRQSKENFAILLNKAGAPKIADVKTFMDQSEAKKVDTLFELFPNENLNEVDQEIEEAKEEVSHWTRQRDGAEATVSRLTASKNEIELPAGSIAEIRDELKNIDGQISDLEGQIKAAEIEEAETAAAEKAKREAEANKKPDSIDEKISGMEREFEDFKNSGNYPDPEEPKPHPTEKLINAPNPAESIQKIIDAIRSTGCGACAALIIAKCELKKYKR